MDIDDAKKESVFEGNVMLTQGTMMIKADKIIVKQDAQGFQYGIAYGNPAHFRQKREGVRRIHRGLSASASSTTARPTSVQMFANARIQRGSRRSARRLHFLHAVRNSSRSSAGKTTATPAIRRAGCAR